MKIFCNRIFYAILFTGLLLTGFKSSAQTTVWLVRHAEKEADAGDPVLTKDGRQRANDLSKKLESSDIAAVWTTGFLRTRQTAEPVAKHFNLVPKVYIDFHLVADTILNDYKNKNVLVVGHSNTIIPTIVALGAVQPFGMLVDGDFDMLFKVTIDKDGHATLEAGYYGSSHHTTQIPEQYLKVN